MCPNKHIATGGRNVITSKLQCPVIIPAPINLCLFSIISFISVCKNALLLPPQSLYLNTIVSSTLLSPNAQGRAPLLWHQSILFPSEIHSIDTRRTMVARLAHGNYLLNGFFCLSNAFQHCHCFNYCLMAPQLITVGRFTRYDNIIIISWRDHSLRCLPIGSSRSFLFRNFCVKAIIWCISLLAPPAHAIPTLFDKFMNSI